MNLVEVVVAILGIFVGDHLVGGTLEAHAHVAPRAGDSIAAVYFNHRHFAGGVCAESAPALQHVPFEILVALADLHHVLAFYSGVDRLLGREEGTLQRLQYYILQVSQR